MAEDVSVHIFDCEIETGIKPDRFPLDNGLAGMIASTVERTKDTATKGDSRDV